jgi:acyl-CoA thioesterase FadM
MHSFPAETRPFPVMLQRAAFGPRLVARAGDVWRGMQDVVVDQSSSVGWTPERYAETNTMFIVRSMTVRHERELLMGEPLVGRTWPARARRDMFFTREVRLFAGEQLVVAGSQEWVYLTRDLQPTRAGAELYAAFALLDGFPSVTLPTTEPVEGAPVHSFSFRSWHTWMDPFAHINHPAYLDFCDENTSRVLAQAGVDPQRLSAVAETVHFRLAIGADQEVTVETHLSGLQGETATLSHRLLSQDKVCAVATTVRRLAAGPPVSWAAVFGAR